MRFADQKLLDAGRCIGLVHLLLRFQVVAEEFDEFWDEGIGNLIAEHVDKLNAGSFNNREIINRLTLLNLQLRDDKLLNVAFE